MKDNQLDAINVIRLSYLKTLGKEFQKTISNFTSKDLKNMYVQKELILELINSINEYSDVITEDTGYVLEFACEKCKLCASCPESKDG